MLFSRQKCLLALLNAHGGEVGSLDFQKLLFLYCQGVETTPSYEFVPYRFGGFSFTSYADKRRLIEQGFLVDDERSWKLTPSGIAAAVAARDSHHAVDVFAKKYAHLRGNALVAEAYRRYPYYAIRSEIAEKVLRQDVSALQAIYNSCVPKHSAGICTIGYEGKSLEKYLNVLLLDGVTLLCDVRRNPLSRKYGFSKSTLSKSCEGIGVRYEHLPELGIDSDKRRQLNSQTDYDLLFEEYELEELPEQRQAISTICSWVESGERVALTCYEHLPEQCHRHCVAEAVERALKIKATSKHL